MNQKILDLEFRWVIDYKRSPEIVRWVKSEVQGDYCYTVAKWKKDSEGYSLEFIGSRPLDSEIDKDVFWELVKYGQKICDANFDLGYFIDENRYLRDTELSNPDSGTNK